MRLSPGAHANSTGYRPRLIDEIVDGFYARIRADEVLGRIVDGVILDGWSIHLTRMKDFWSSVMMMTGRYNIVGSNIYNILGLGGATALIAARRSKG